MQRATAICGACCESEGTEASFASDELHKICQRDNLEIGGYTGLFSLLAGYQTHIFAGVGAVSPSVWYQDWQEYAKEHRMKIPKVYLSLGDKEENAKNKVLATVGDAIRSQFDELKEQGVTTTLEWNEGNHFVDSGNRMGKALAWLFTA